MNSQILQKKGLIEILVLFISNKLFKIKLLKCVYDFGLTVCVFSNFHKYAWIAMKFVYIIKAHSLLKIMHVAFKVHLQRFSKEVRCIMVNGFKVYLERHTK